MMRPVSQGDAGAQCVRTHHRGDAFQFPESNLRLYKEIRRRNIPTLFIHNHYQNETFDSVEMSDARAGYELTRILIQNGHTRIGGIFKYDDWQGIEALPRLYSSACRISGSISGGLDPLVFDPGYGRKLSKKDSADVPPDEGLYRDDPLQRRGGGQLYGFF